MQEKLILIEDDSELRESLLEFLTLSGLTVTGVGSAIEFYQALNIEHFDIAIVDVGLPDQSGYELSKYLRKNTTMGVIILTARSSAEDRIQGYDAGADLYFVKPVNSQELIAAIRNLIERLNCRRNEQQEEMRKDWFLDKSEWTLTGPNGLICKLTSKELSFLEELISKHGNPVTRESLMIRLDYNPNQYDNRSLDALVLRLRKKIEEKGCHGDPIKTVHAVGYCFSAPVRTSHFPPRKNL